jgi:hypothetical protein
MGEIERWFIEEFGHLGFSLTPTMLDPFTFSPTRRVLYQDRLTDISVIPEIVQDLHATGYDPEREYKEILTQSIERFLLEQGKSGDFTPNRNITRFKFND